MPLGAILGGSAILGSLLGAKGQSEANEKNIELAREQMAFQERMSSTAYQRGMEDMRKAGLNPMLAFQKGGASSPSGQTAQIKNPFEGFGPTAISAATSAAQIGNIQAQTDKTRTEDQLLEEDLKKKKVIRKPYEYIDNIIEDALKPASAKDFDRKERSQQRRKKKRAIQRQKRRKPSIPLEPNMQLKDMIPGQRYRMP